MLEAWTSTSRYPRAMRRQLLRGGALRCDAMKRLYICGEAGEPQPHQRPPRQLRLWLRSRRQPLLPNPRRDDRGCRAAGCGFCRSGLRDARSRGAAQWVGFDASLRRVAPPAGLGFSRSGVRWTVEQRCSQTVRWVILCRPVLVQPSRPAPTPAACRAAAARLPRRCPSRWTPEPCRPRRWRPTPTPRRWHRPCKRASANHWVRRAQTRR